MAKVKVKIPKLGLTVEVAMLTEWKKSAGDAVEAGEIIATIEADKASYEIEAPVGGVLTELLVEADQDEEHDVGTHIATIEV